ncbi:transmembrane domain-containing protein [Streptomyces sp. NBC_00080]|uniref:EGFR-like transmembrane domain-containing protein n=1 Tax=Streptomyces TaxID=1883 RepID=UPI0011517324|nr:MULTISPECIES: transmembrane domain-containing protein [Streptomyces]TQJ47290.1 putative secreted protein with PEP-CTERM sorting signal [Streptomyces sp. SLBN-115]
MIASIVPSVVLGLVLLGAAAAWILRRRDSLPGPVRTARPSVHRKELETVALGLRAVAEGRAPSAGALPEVHAVIHSGQRLTLLLAGADAPAPAPWTADLSGKEWWVEPKDLTSPANGGAEVAHPYSLAVTLGRHRGDRVLVDLSLLSGAIALTGEDNDVLSLAQALITELIGGPVGSLATVVLVGSAATASVTDGLGARSARLRAAATRDEALACRDSVPTGADRRSPALQTSPPDSTARVTAWTHARRLFVVTAAQFRDENWRDAALRGTDALLVLGYVGDDADWNFHVNADGSLDTGRLGLPIDTHAARLD